MSQTTTRRPASRYKGVVNWFNVARGFGELAIPSSKYFFLVRHGRVPASPRDPRVLPGLFSPECKHHSLLLAFDGHVGTGATASPFTHRARPRHLRGKKALRGARHRTNLLGKLIGPSSRAPAGFVTRDDGVGDVFVHQSDIYAEGFRSLRDQEPVEFELEPMGDGRYKAVKVRFASSPKIQDKTPGYLSFYAGVSGPLSPPDSGNDGLISPDTSLRYRK